MFRHAPFRHARAATVIALMLVVGCSHRPRQNTAADEGQPTPEARREREDPILVSYHRTGGIAGTDDRLVVWSDGFAHAAGVMFGASSGRLTEQELADLRTLLADWGHAAETIPGTPAADTFLVQISHAGRTVAADDTSRPSRTFSDVREALEGLARRIRPTNPPPQ
ncbi:MAG TPA: hypothetical protein VFB66_06495 [Tepidisphaeraceae bacterium]|nr:hypothetical protein [Tepidisphaeraceae bacterium]